MLTVYCYQNCSTCRNALKWLDQHGIAHRVRPIRETPPSPAELRAALKAKNGDLRKLFNTSSNDYRELGIKDRLDDLSETEAFEILRSNGNLVKRPFVIGDGVALIGFKPDEWSATLIP
ncbi:MAG: arsenate reductase family protein [Verrucomicrobia bacterium]|nr:arsenate reductase family protein [Verrucomicrobiota bacterium]